MAECIDRRRVTENRLRPAQLPQWAERIRLYVSDSGPLEGAVRTGISRYACMLISERDKLVDAPERPNRGDDAAFYEDRLDLIGPPTSEQRTWFVGQLVRAFGPGRPALEPVPAAE